MKTVLFPIVSLLFFLTACERSRITTGDLMRAQGISAFVCKLPSNLKSTDIVGLETFDENGPVELIFNGEGFKPSELCKVFLMEVPTGYQLSVLGDTMSWSQKDLPTSGLRLAASLGGENHAVIEVGEGFLVFSNEGSASYIYPKGDDLSLRLVIRSPAQTE